MKKSKRLFELCGDILFPRRCPFCDAVLGFSGPCAVCGPALACIRRPLRQPVPKQGHALEHLDAAYAPYFYEPPVRDAVLGLKFEKRTDLARPLALLQAEELKAAGCLGDVDALVPVPSGRGERRSRGYDVPLMLARALGRELGLPEYLVSRQPFPGPGLAIRIIGDITKEKADTLRLADFIFREELSRAGEDQCLSQYFAVLTNTRSVGVMGDGRTYDYTLALRAVTTDDFMTADWARIPYDVLDRISVRIVNEVQGINRIVYDITSKPPATIEWE